MKNEIKSKINIPKKVFYISLIVVVILSLLLMISRNFGDFNNVKLRQNNKNIFSQTDLTIGNLKFGDKEQKVINELGKPTKTKSVQKNIYDYKELYYDGLVVTLKENYNDYILVKVEITSRKYKINRNIKVGKRILRVMKKFKVEHRLGTYIYGNYSVEELSNTENKENIYFGIRSNNEVVYVYRDSVVDGDIVNIARLNISYKNGKVTKIVWSYDVE